MLQIKTDQKTVYDLTFKEQGVDGVIRTVTRRVVILFVKKIIGARRLWWCDADNRGERFGSADLNDNTPYEAGLQSVCKSQA